MIGDRKGIQLWRPFQSRHGSLTAVQLLSSHPSYASMDGECILNDDGGGDDVWSVVSGRANMNVCRV